MQDLCVPSDLSYPHWIWNMNLLVLKLLLVRNELCCPQPLRQGSCNPTHHDETEHFESVNSRDKRWMEMKHSFVTSHNLSRSTMGLDVHAPPVTSREMPFCSFQPLSDRLWLFNIKVEVFLWLPSKQIAPLEMSLKVTQKNKMRKVQLLPECVLEARFSNSATVFQSQDAPKNPEGCSLPVCF